jgi:endonuclease/exonuclease/phosphatase family metal-dependent hydrolase
MLRRSLLVAVSLLALACREESSGDDDDDGADAGVDAGPEDPGPHPGEVWVMTWNLQLFPLTASAPGRVRQTLADYPADLVAVQEIDSSAAFVALDEALPQYTGLLANDATGDTRVGLLYRQGQVQIDDVRTLFSNDSTAFPRPPLAVHATSQGIDFTVVVLHLKALGGEENEERRRQAIAKIDAWIVDEVAAGGDPDVVVLGDWNDELTKPAGDNVFTLLLDRPDDYRFLTLALEIANDDEYGTYIPRPGFLDHILITTDGLTEWGQGVTEILRLDDQDPQYEAAVSDHRPVLTKFRP